MDFDASLPAHMTKGTHDTICSAGRAGRTRRPEDLPIAAALQILRISMIAYYSNVTDIYMN